MIDMQGVRIYFIRVEPVVNRAALALARAAPCSPGISGIFIYLEEVEKAAFERGPCQ
jgi:hypothetical protein